MTRRRARRAARTGGDEIVFARSSPEDKLRIATRLQAAGHVVAMTGDGVNDAPALRKADIGVAMGRSGTDVAREAATMVLTDDDFATIIEAVESGRRVYDNVRKFILYIFAHAVPEIVPFLLFALSGGAIPLGLTVVQILIIDLGTETLPALALGREPAEPGLMQRPPRPSARASSPGGCWCGPGRCSALISAVLVSAGFLWVLCPGWLAPGRRHRRGHPAPRGLPAGDDDDLRRHRRLPGGNRAGRPDRPGVAVPIGLLTNRLLLGGIAFELAVTAVVIYLPAAQDFLGTRSRCPPELAVLAVFPVLVWVSTRCSVRWVGVRTRNQA